jgi:hypothetical protein
VAALPPAFLAFLSNALAIHAVEGIHGWLCSFPKIHSENEKARKPISELAGL